MERGPGARGRPDHPAALLKQGADDIYTIVDKQWATSNYSGWHFLPSVAIVGTKGIITFFWKQENALLLSPFERSGDSLVSTRRISKRSLPGPTSPNYMFHSKAVNHGDEIMFAYFDMDKSCNCCATRTAPGSTATPPPWET